MNPPLPPRVSHSCKQKKSAIKAVRPNYTSWSASIGKQRTGFPNSKASCAAPMPQ